MKLFHFPRKEPAAEAKITLTELLPYPHRIFPAGTALKELEREYFAAAERGKREGFTPILVRADETLTEHMDYLLKDGYSAAETLRDGADAEKGRLFLQERLKNYWQEPEPDYEKLCEGADVRAQAISSFASLHDYATRKTAETILFELPTENPWEAAAYIPFGGWNECPAPADMLNVFRYWFEEYRAVPAVIGADTLEMTVPAPVSADGAARLAIEHFMFCPDRVFQATASGTPAELAKSLGVSTVWYFWWD